ASTCARCPASSRANRAIARASPGSWGKADKSESAWAAAFFSQWAWSTSTSSKRSIARPIHSGGVAHKSFTRSVYEVMRIGVISDTHGLLRPEVIEAFREVDHILHCGDIGGEDVLDELRTLAPLTACA